MPSPSRRALILVLVLGILYWFLDAAYLYTSFQAGEVVIPGEQGPSFWGVLVTDVPHHVLAGRLTFLTAMLLVAAVAVVVARRRDRRETSLLHQLESAGDLFSRHDLRGRFLYASAGFDALLGVAPESLRGQLRVPGWTVVNAADVAAAWGRLAASEQPVSAISRLRHDDGRELWLESVGRRVASGRDDEVVVVSRDVSARHRAEAALAASEQRLRLITENTQEILWLRVGDRLQYINSAVERVFGVAQDRMGSDGLRAWLPWLHPEDRERVRLTMDHALNHHEPLDEEFRIVRADGQVRWLHARTVHVETDPEGRPVAVGVAADVTGRRRAEDTLRSTVARYRTLYDAAHVGITITDLAGNLLYVNSAAAELYGAESVPSLLNHARRHDGIRTLFLDPAARDEFVAAMKSDERGRASRIIAMRRIDGDEVSMRVSCGLMTNPETGRQEILAILEDVTERQRAEADLRRSEERYRRLVEFLPDAVLVHDCHRVMFANPACNRLFAPAGEGVVGRELAELAGSPDLLAPESPAGGEVWLQRRDGTRLPAQVTSLPMEAGQVLTVVKDLTHLRRAGEEIAAQQAILEALIETMPLGIVAKDLDQDLCYVVWNRYMEEELGLGKDAVLGRCDRDIFPADFAANMRDHDLQAAARGDAVDLGEVVVPWADARLTLRAVKVPVRDADGRVARVFTIVENITRQKQLQASLQQSRRMEAVGRLSAAVAHDFNNVLQIVQGYTEVIERDLGRAPAAGDEVALVLAAVSRARQLIQRLLSYSRYDTVNPELLDLDQLGERLVALSRTQLPDAITLAFTPGGNLPRVYADPQQIEEALLNLIINARDALPGEGVIEMRTAVVDLGHDFCSTRPWARPGRYIQIAVHDEGCGIPPDARDHVYEPFYSTKGFGQGTGLGLAIAYAICKRHHGYLDFESELDVGTTFHLFLPLPAVTAEAVEPVRPAGATLPEPAGRGELLLVVDDDDMVRSLTRQMLERAGYQVLDARDGEDAMELFMSHAAEVAALVIDVVMPRMDGRQLYDNISELRPGVPVLFCSSYSANLLESEYMLRVRGSLLPKPFRASELLQRVRRLLDEAPEPER